MCIVLQQGDRPVSAQPPQQSTAGGATRGPVTSTGDPEKDKKIKNLRKVGSFLSGVFLFAVRLSQFFVTLFHHVFKYKKNLVKGLD